MRDVFDKDFFSLETSFTEQTHFNQNAHAQIFFLYRMKNKIIFEEKITLSKLKIRGTRNRNDLFYRLSLTKTLYCFNEH